MERITMNHNIATILGIIIAALSCQSNYTALPQPTQPTLKPLTLTRSVSHPNLRIKNIARSAAANAQNDTDQSTMDAKSKQEACAASQTTATGTCASISTQSATQNTQSILTLRQAMDYASSLVPPMPDEQTDLRVSEEIERRLVAYAKELKENNIAALSKLEVKGIVDMVITDFPFKKSQNNPATAAGEAITSAYAQPVVMIDPILTLNEAMQYSISLVALPKRAKDETLEAIENDLTEYLEITRKPGISQTQVKEVTEFFIEQAREQLRKGLAQSAKK